MIRIFYGGALATIFILLVCQLKHSFVFSQGLCMSVGVCRFMHSPESSQLASSMEAGDRWAVSRGSRLIDVFWG